MSYKWIEWKQDCHVSCDMWHGCVTKLWSWPEPVYLSTRPSALPSATHSVHPKLSRSVNVVLTTWDVLTYLLPSSRETCEDQRWTYKDNCHGHRAPTTHYQERLRGETDLHRLLLALYFFSKWQGRSGRGSPTTASGLAYKVRRILYKTNSIQSRIFTIRRLI